MTSACPGALRGRRLTSFLISRRFPPDRQDGPAQGESQHTIHEPGYRYQAIVPEPHLARARLGCPKKNKISSGSEDTERVQVDALFLAQALRRNGAQRIFGVPAKMTDSGIERGIEPRERGREDDNHSVRFQVPCGQNELFVIFLDVFQNIDVENCIEYLLRAEIRERAHEDFAIS